jgi:[ribosomal protein S5]-alanine N-acetyltransferase
MQPHNPFVRLPTLETERLVLRAVSEDDIDAVFAFASDPLVAEHTSWLAHQTRDESAAQVARWLARYRSAEPVPWGIEQREDRQLVGRIGFLWWQGYTAELAFALSRQYWNQGYMTEALREVLRFGFETMGLNRIQATCNASNVASSRVMEKAGLTCEGVLREHIHSKGAFHDRKMYSILRREWRSDDSCLFRREHVSGLAKKHP